MPRRNHRPEHVEFTPTVIEIVKRPARDERAWIEEREYRACMEAGSQRAIEAEAKQRKARIEQNMDWDVCLVYGCTGRTATPTKLWSLSTKKPDPDANLPLCLDHLTIAWRQMQKLRGNPEVIQAVDDLNRKLREKAEREAAETQARYLASREGEIYFLRQNGLVKVGWSRDLYARLRAYGPGVELLCHYEASRDDETNLHRQLRPALAQGREWYHDGDVVALFLNQALTKHGPPRVTYDWTKPKAPTIRQHGRARR